MSVATIQPRQADAPSRTGRTAGLQMPPRGPAGRAQARGTGKPRRSRDALPENTRYRDDGCSVSRSCFTCPLPRCRYEEPGGLRAVLNQQRDSQILELRAGGASVEELAVRFSVSRRTVFRVLEGTSPRSRRRRDSAPVPIFLRRSREGEARKEASCA